MFPFEIFLGQARPDARSNLLGVNEPLNQFLRQVDDVGVIATQLPYADFPSGNSASNLGRDFNCDVLVFFKRLSGIYSSVKREKEDGSV